MTKTRQLAAVQKVGPGPDHMPIGEFGGAAALPGDGSPFFSAPMYWFYEMGHAALTPARAFADAGRMFYKNPANPFAHTSAGKAAAAAFELFERTTRRYSQPEWGIDSTMVGGERVPVHIKPHLGTAVLPAAAFRARARACAETAAAETADRRADVGPLCDAVARHRRGIPAEPRRLHHRMGRCPHGAARGRALRSRRLHRLRDLDAACARRRDPYRRRVPALRAGARRGRLHGGGRTTLTCRSR